jgi:flagellar capping protein FliD
LLTEVAEKGRKLSHLVTKLTAKTKEIADQYYVFSNYMESANKELNKLIPDLK